jgi:hypothetical protein
MGGPASLESAGRCEAGSVFNDSDNATIQRESAVCQANTGQVGGWLPDAPPDGPYGACSLPAVAALKDSGVCELEYCPLPPVCVADDEAAAADAAKARAVGRETLGRPDTKHIPNSCSPTEQMPKCPSEWDDFPAVGWKDYEGFPSVFHCGFDLKVADCSPDPDHLQQECAYKAKHLVEGVKEDVKKGDLVDIDYRCAGTPNADDVKEHPIRHFFTKGGIVDEGVGGLVGSIEYYDRLEHESENETDPADSSE